MPIVSSKEIQIDELFQTEYNVPEAAGVDSEGTTTLFYAYGKLVAEHKEEDLKYYFQDGLGSNRLDSEGNEFKSLPFGQELINSGNILEFTGKELDDGSGLNYFGTRYYDSSIGRFLSVDPVRDNQAYIYVNNDPMNYIDPTGENPADAQLAQAMIDGHTFTIDWGGVKSSPFMVKATKVGKVAGMTGGVVGTTAFYGFVVKDMVERKQWGQLSMMVADEVISGYLTRSYRGVRGFCKGIGVGLLVSALIEMEIYVINDVLLATFDSGRISSMDAHALLMEEGFRFGHRRWQSMSSFRGYKPKVPAMFGAQMVDRYLTHSGGGKVLNKKGEVWSLLLNDHTASNTAYSVAAGVVLGYAKRIVGDKENGIPGEILGPDDETRFKRAIQFVRDMGPEYWSRGDRTITDEDTGQTYNFNFFEQSKEMARKNAFNRFRQEHPYVFD